MAIPYSRTIIGNLPWYSVLIVLGMLAAIWLLGKETARQGLPKDTAVDVALVAVPCGIIGARLYYVAMTWQTFAADPISILYIWNGGVAIYGGVLGGSLGAFVYAKRKKLSFFQLADCAAPGILLAQAIGRWGNYFNMEAYGEVITNPAFQFFPAGVLINAGGEWTWHMATFFYESLWNLSGFAALWLMRKRQNEKGNTFFWYLLIYGSGRFIIEQMRQDSLYMGGFRVSQYLSLVLCAVAVCVLVYRAVKGERGRAALMIAAALILLTRWLVIGNMAVYAALAVAGAAMIAFGIGCRRNTMRLIAPLVLDAAGICCLISCLPSASLGLRLHTLICSVTMPLYIYSAAFPSEITARKQG